MRIPKRVTQISYLTLLMGAALLIFLFSINVFHPLWIRVKPVDSELVVECESSDLTLCVYESSLAYLGSAMDDYSDWKNRVYVELRKVEDSDWVMVVTDKSVFDDSILEKHDKLFWSATEDGIKLHRHESSRKIRGWIGWTSMRPN